MIAIHPAGGREGRQFIGDYERFDNAMAGKGAFDHVPGEPGNVRISHQPNSTTVNEALVIQAADAIRELDRVTGRPLTAEDQARAVLAFLAKQPDVTRDALKQMLQVFDSDTARRMYTQGHPDGWTMLEVGACQDGRAALHQLGFGQTADTRRLDQLQKLVQYSSNSGPDHEAVAHLCADGDLIVALIEQEGDLRKALDQVHPRA